MRLMPLLTAALVLVTLYMLVMERPALLALAGASPAGAQSEAAATPTPGTPADAAGSAPMLRVVVQRIEQRGIESGVILRGRTEAARRVEVRAETSGLVASEPRPRGSAIDQGDLLCELAPGTRLASLAEAEARLAEAEINFTAATRLSEGGFAAQTRVASAEAAVRGAQAAVQAATTELGRLELRAPFAGVLETDTAERGSLLSPGGLCATLIRLDPIRLVGFAAESQIDRLEVGAVAGGRLPGGREVLGRVSFVARSADPATRTFRVEVTVPNTDLSIREGMSVDILIQAASQQGHLVPASALTLDNGGRLGLRLVDEDSVTFFAPVSVLRDTAQGFWVAGLPVQADVVVVGQEFVTDGVRVEAVRRDAAPRPPGE
jgi:membrane fusion protein, multidrug efflux system